MTVKTLIEAGFLFGLGLSGAQLIYALVWAGGTQLRQRFQIWRMEKRQLESAKKYKELCKTMGTKYAATGIGKTEQAPGAYGKDVNVACDQAQQEQEAPTLDKVLGIARQ